MANIFDDIKNTRVARNPLDSLSRFGKILATGQAPQDASLDAAYKVAQINALNNKSTQPNFLLGQDGNLMPLPTGKIIQQKPGFVPKDANVPEGFTLLPNGKIAKDPTYHDPNAPLPPSVEARKIKATEGLYDTVNKANVNYGRIERGIDAAGKLPQGALGKAQLTWMKMFDSKNPTLGDWQEMKSLLTDAQLQNVAKTKGAISDREMALFSSAAANDDYNSVVRQTKVLEAMKRAIFADQESKLSSFQRSFKENPREWGDLNVQNPFQEIPSFSSPEEADNSGLKPGTVVIVNGRKYQIG